MQTEQPPETATLVFLQTVSAAVTQLKQKLQQDYERVYPDLRDIIYLVPALNIADQDIQRLCAAVVSVLKGQQDIR